MIEQVLKYGYNIDYPFTILNEDGDTISADSYKELVSRARIYEDHMYQITKIAKNIVDDDRPYYIDISGKDLEYADMQTWFFKRVNFSNCLLRSSNISNAQFESCIIKNADFEDAIAHHTGFRNSILTGSKFVYTSLATADFSKANLDNVSFQLAILEGAYFCDVILNHTNFEDACLVASNFDDATIRNVNFNRADLTRADLSRVKIESASWNDCIMENAKLDNVMLIQFDLEDDEILEMLSEADLSKANWSGVSESQRQKLKGCIDVKSS